MLGLVLAPTPSAAGALFIVNQPWVRPAKTAQTTEAYMNLTSTDGARLVAVRTDAAKEAAIRAPGKTHRQRAQRKVACGYAGRTRAWPAIGLC